MNRPQIALAVRKNAERVAKSETLAGWCGICSMALVMAFRNNGFDAQAVWGYFEQDEHCVVDSGGKYYDITATQFGETDFVMVMEHEDDRFVREETYSNYKSFKDWGKRQRPSVKLTRKLLRNIKDLS